MPRHRAETEWSRTRVLAVVGAFVVLVPLVFGGYALLTGDGDEGAPEAGRGTQDETSATTSGGATGAQGQDGDDRDDMDAALETGATDCAEPQVVGVAAAPQIAPVIEQVAEGLGEGCTDYEVTAVPAAAVLATLAGQGETDEGATGDGATEDGATDDGAADDDAVGAAPDIWVPDSTLWVELAAAQGAPLTPGPVVATSPIALVGPADTIAETGLESGAGWAELLGAGAPLRASDPQQDAASLLTLLTAQAAFGDDAAGQQRAAGVLINLGRQLTPADELLAAAKEGEAVVFPSSEQTVAGDDALAAVVPEGGLGTLSYPVVTMPGGEADVAADMLSEALLSEDGAAALAGAGLRPGEDGAGPGVAGIPEQAPDLAAQPDAAQVADATARWSSLTREQRMLAVLDVSGSMDEEVGDTTRIGIAAAAAERAMGLMRPGSQVGAWKFSTARGEDGEDYAELVPIRTLREQVGQRTHADVLLDTVGALDEDATTGDTGLHDTVLAAFVHMQETYDPAYVNSVVLLTDGVNDDSTGGLSEDELIAELESRADPERPVTVVLVGMGPSVDGGALQRIAEATGGRAYVAEDPADIIDVFLDAVSHRAGR